MVGQTAPDSETFNPLPEPVTLEFWFLMQRLESSGVPFVGVGRRYGPRLPQVREPSPDAPSLLSIDQDVQRVEEARRYWAQPWYPNPATVANAEERAQRRALWQSPGKWQPARRVSMQLWASVQRHLRLKSDEELAEFLELDGEEVRHSSQARRYRVIDKIVARGDEAWAALGAWPWAAFPKGRPPKGWHLTDAACASLADAVRLRRQEVADLCAALDHVLAELGATP